jgi:sortase (surface protein transpeptidase)
VAPKGHSQEAGVTSSRRIGTAFHWRRLFLATLLLVASLGLLAAGLSGLLLTRDDQPKLTNVGSLEPTGTPATPAFTPPPSSAAIARLIIDKIGVDAQVVTLGLDENGIPMVPDNPYDVAWYDWSSRPGSGSNAVFAGHFDWTVNGQPVAGVFYSLADLSVGDIIEVNLADGTDYKYKVIGNLAIPDEDPQAMQVMAATPSDMITLLTCGGVWTRDPSNPLGGSYDHRQVVRAELIPEEPAPPPDQGHIAEPQQEGRQG